MILSQQCSGLADRRHGSRREHIGSDQATLSQIPLDDLIHPDDDDANGHTMLCPLSDVRDRRADHFQLRAGLG